MPEEAREDLFAYSGCTEAPAGADAEGEAAAVQSGSGEEKRGSNDGNDPNEARSVKRPTTTAKDVEMEDTERKTERPST